MDKRGLLTFALCFLVLIIYYKVILPVLFPTPTKGKAPATSDEQQPPGTGRPGAATTGTPSPTPRKPAAAQTIKPEPAVKTPEPPKVVKAAPKPEFPIQDSIVVETDLYRSVWTSRGGALKTLVLKKFRALEGKDALLLLDPIRNPESVPTSGHTPDRSSLALDLHSFELQDAQIDYALEREPFEVQSSADASELRFSARLFADAARTQPVVVTKTFTFAQGQYHIDVKIAVANLSTIDIEPVYTLSAGTGIASEDQVRPRLEALAGKAKGKGEINITRKMAMKLSQKPFNIVRESWDVRWAGIANKYFAAVLVADEHTFQHISQASLWGPTDDDKLGKLSRDPRLREDKARNMATNVGAALRMAMPAMSPGERHEHRFRYFIGPKSRDVLAAYSELKQLPGYGWFAAISRVLVGILGGCYAIVKNYGIAIIILTFIVRLCLHPLSRKSQMSMHHMQKLQPKIAELREKHKNNKRKQSEEQMKLFREHGVNPMSGCLPIFLQLPIFIALYRGLDLSVELRQAPFMLWINDLSKPDVLCPLPFALPLVGWTTLHVLPIAMTVTMVIQQQMMPKSTDPQQQQQQKMMMFMPVMFLFIMYRMPSGLTLYWFTSTLLGILEQKLIKARLAKLD